MQYTVHWHPAFSEPWRRWVSCFFSIRMLLSLQYYPECFLGIIIATKMLCSIKGMMGMMRLFYRLHLKQIPFLILKYLCISIDLFILHACSPLLTYFNFSVIVLGMSPINNLHFAPIWTSLLLFHFLSHLLQRLTWLAVFPSHLFMQSGLFMSPVFLCFSASFLLMSFQMLFFYSDNPNDFNTVNFIFPGLMITVLEKRLFYFLLLLYSFF